jgi:hypothetical protein
MKANRPDDALLARAVAAIRASGHAGFLHIEEATCLPLGDGFLRVYVDDAAGADVPPGGFVTNFFVSFEGGALIGVTHCRSRKRVDGGWDTFPP